MWIVWAWLGSLTVLVGEVLCVECVCVCVCVCLCVQRCWTEAKGFIALSGPMRRGGVRVGSGVVMTWWSLPGPDDHANVLLKVYSRELARGVGRQ